jgi:hypothetical protein
MRKIITILFLSAIGMILLQSSIMKTMRVQGAEPGHTGSPGDGKDCTTCHGGDAATVPGWITSNIPATGYVPGERYSITATNWEQEGTRFGFQVSPQNLAGDLLGTLIVTDSVQTQLVGNGKYMTYTENGVNGIGSKSWTFDWIAPDHEVGEVTFYGAYNSNFEGHKGSNHVFLSSLTVKKGWPTKVSDISKDVSNFLIYPNPAKDDITINFALETESDLVLDIIDIVGQQVAQVLNERKLGAVSCQFDTRKLPSGNYFVRLQVNGKILTQKLTVNH